ncbi:MAG TPA: molybdenum cofactor guanylyltransferase [Nitrospira sp.]|jgi:molybdopterin-guanine dinucleotide biosynthesis protein A|nr:molybdenum cofactor guanylyltransferase [Nitrospira sp.]
MSALISDVTGVLLAGGKSRRMGQDKRFLSIGAETLYERSLTVLRSVFPHVLVVIAQDSPPIESEAPVLRDLIPDCGSLGGLYTGLKQAGTEWVFAVACDMPFLNPATIRHFVGVKRDADVVMAKLQNGLQPMHALYHTNCLPVMEKMISAGNLKLHRLADHPALRVRLVVPEELSLVDPQGRSFYNVNTPEDLEAARLLLGRSVKPSSS